MADQIKYPGRLIAIDGSRGKDVTLAASDLADRLKHDGIECAVSRWDASGLFTDLVAGGRGDHNVSVRTLSLVYAADLAFRLRWEIRPILEAGGVVVAASYVESAVAFGASCGLAEDWLRRLMRFAPPANYLGLVNERKIDRPWKRRTDRGYPEYAALMLEAAAPKRVAKPARRRMMAMLERARGRNVFHLTNKRITALSKALTGSLTDASRRSASRPRNGRK